MIRSTQYGAGLHYTVVTSKGQVVVILVFRAKPDYTILPVFMRVFTELDKKRGWICAHPLKEHALGVRQGDLFGRGSVLVFGSCGRCTCLRLAWVG